VARKYDSDYTNYKFIKVGNDIEQKAQFFQCYVAERLFADLIEGPNKIFSKSGPWAEKSCEALL